MFVIFVPSLARAPQDDGYVFRVILRCEGKARASKDGAGGNGSGRFCKTRGRRGMIASHPIAPNHGS